MGVLNFIINEIFNQGAIFLALIACIGLILQNQQEKRFMNKGARVVLQQRILQKQR